MSNIPIITYNEYDDTCIILLPLKSTDIHITLESSKENNKIVYDTHLHYYLNIDDNDNHPQKIYALKGEYEIDHIHESNNNIIVKLK